MLIYISMLCISLVFASFIKKTNSTVLNKFFLCCSAFPFFIVSALRYDVGTDYMFRYTRDFIRILSGRTVYDLEIGFKILYDICIFFTTNSQLIFIITSLIITLFIFSSIYKNSANIKQSILLYFIGAFFFQSLNLTREYLCISIMLFSYKYLLDKKITKWLFWMAISTLFHSTSIIYAVISLGIYLFTNKSKKSDIILDQKVMLLIVLLMMLAGPIIKESILAYMSFTRFRVYIGSVFDYGDLQIIPFFINIILYLWMSYIASKKEKIDIETKYYLYVQFLCICFIGMGKYVYLINRITYYFAIFQIISIPYFLSLIKEKLRKKIYIVNIVIIIVVFSLSLTWTHILHTTDEVLPYKTILNIN